MNTKRILARAFLKGNIAFQNYVALASYLVKICRYNISLALSYLITILFLFNESIGFFTLFSSFVTTREIIWISPELLLIIRRKLCISSELFVIIRREVTISSELLVIIRKKMTIPSELLYIIDSKLSIVYDKLLKIDCNFMIIQRN